MFKAKGSCSERPGGRWHLPKSRTVKKSGHLMSSEEKTAPSNGNHSQVHLTKIKVLTFIRLIRKTNCIGFEK